MSISISNISFGFSTEKPVLNGINIDIAKGETIAVVGASGCGKSTLLRLISGILPKSKNETFFGKITIDDITPSEYVRQGKIAFMFQEATLMPNLTVKENIEFPLKIKGIKNDEKVNELIAVVGLTNFANYFPKELSGGMKTRVALARSFVTQPELLLLDEPFSALDIAWKSKLYIELEKLKSQNNTTVILVSHDIQEGLFLSNRILVIGKKGSIIDEIKVDTKYSSIDRIDKISDYIQTEEYQKNIVQIQASILTDAYRAITDKDEFERILKKIENSAGSENEIWPGLELDIIALRNYSNDKRVNEILFNAFQKANSFFLKYEIMWDILEYENIDENIIKLIAQFYLDNIAIASQQALRYYNVKEDNLFEHLIQFRIEKEKYNLNKRWIYMCDMYASSQREKVLMYLTDVENGNNKRMNSEIAKWVASEIKLKLHNEKLDSISIT